MTATEDLERHGGPLEIDAEMVEDLQALLRADQRGMVLNLVADLYPADLSRLLIHLPFDEAYRLFHWLPDEEASEVLAELEGSFRADLLSEMHTTRITSLLDELETDDAADVLAELPNEIALQVLPQLEDAEDLEQLLGYDEDTAGGIMGTEYVAVPRSWTVNEATEEVRRNAETVENVYAIFVIDAQEVLQGVISLKRLLLSPGAALVGDIMEPEFISVKTDVDQEEVGRIMQRYDLVSLPVVSQGGRLVGRITIDDVVDVIREEAEEDIQRLSGMGDEEPTDSVLRISRSRLPWLFIGMLGAGLSGMVIGSFEGALQQAVVLATFIPVVMAMAGNVGIQSSSIVVQGLASGDPWSSDVLRRLGKEVTVALINGVALAAVLACAVLVLPLGGNAGRLAVTAALSLLTVIVLASVIGTVVPMALHHFKIDPALATGPFITTSNDILGLAVFFLIATLIYL